MDNPYSAPKKSEISEGAITDNVIYAGFWRRFFASFIDTILMMVLLSPFCYIFYGSEYWNSEKFIQGPADFLINYIVPVIIVVIFWIKCGGTPGKLLLGLRVVDEKSFMKISIKQAMIRYVGYFISIIPFFLGFFWMIWDVKKRCWHDMFGGSVVIKLRKNDRGDVSI